MVDKGCIYGVLSWPQFGYNTWPGFTEHCEIDIIQTNFNWGGGRGAVLRGNSQHQMGGGELFIMSILLVSYFFFFIGDIAQN